MNRNDPNIKQMNEQMRTATQMMKEMLDDIDLEGIDLQGAGGSTARRFNCFGTFGSFGTATGCFGTAGTFACRSLNKRARTQRRQSRTSSKRSAL